MEKLNKKEIFIKSIPLLLTLLSCVLLISYAYYKIKLEGQKEHFISTDTISFSYIENEDKISITSVNPLSDTDGKAQSNYFEFNVSSNLTSGMSVDYEISISKITATNNFNDSDVKIYLTDGNNNQIVEPTIISNLVDNSKNNYLSFLPPSHRGYCPSFVMRYTSVRIGQVARIKNSFTLKRPSG